MWHGLVASSKGRLAFGQQLDIECLFFVYFAKSIKNGKVYVGSTSKDPKVRVAEHNKGSNKWSLLNRPLKIIYHEKYSCEKDAKDRELFYKMGFGKAIKKLIVENIEKIMGS